MKTTLKIASAQLNPVVGDLSGNMTMAREAYAKAKAGGADILVLPELFIIGYPPEDLVLKPAAIDDCRRHAIAFAKETKDGPAVVFSTPWFEDDRLYSGVLFMRGGDITDVRYKHHLPNYGVFDEARVFKRGPLPKPVEFKGVKIGLPVCEDLWQEGVARHLAREGAQLLISPNGSPWRRSALVERQESVGTRVHAAGLPLVYVNQVGGQDELVFDGSSFCLQSGGEVAQSLRSFIEDFDISTWEITGKKCVCVAAATHPQLSGYEADWRAMCLGLGDYVNKNRFKQVILGLSGGVDSAAVAAIAVDALGPDRVWCVMMPYDYTSPESLKDAKDCADALKCHYDIIPISPAVEGFEAMLESKFAGLEKSTAEENLQSRTRAVTLMALSNKFGPMLVTTGNKSEMAVGYATLYGDMCGGYNPLKDVYKTEVFKLMDWRNENTPDDLLGGPKPCPQNIIDKPPSAELRPDQKDSDSLPEYDILDDILFGLIEQEIDVEALIARGHKPATVKRIQHLLYLNEYKRRQAPPGVKIGNKNFGRDRRYPITNRYRDAVPGTES